MDDPWAGSVRELARAIREGVQSPVTLVEAYLARISRTNRHNPVYLTVAEEQALAAARRAEEELGRGIDRGALHGVPYACKDVFQTRGLRTTAGSKVLEDWVPDADAAAVGRLAGAGAVLLGKTNLHEFCYGATGENPHFGTVRNPFDLTRLAGGSSSGSAVAVATGLCAYALGTDTGGSVRVPAALCGVVGLKPTYGRVSCHGVVPYCWSLDHVGILTRFVEDAATVLEALAGADSRDPACSDLPVPAYRQRIEEGVGGLRVGVPRGFFFEHVEPEVVRGVTAAVRALGERGARIEEVALPPMEQARTVSLLIQLPEALSFHTRYLGAYRHLYGADVRAGLALGQFLLAEHYVRARRMVQRYRRELEEVFRQVDLVVTPTCPTVAPPLGTARLRTRGLEEAVGNALTRFTSFFNLTGNPALTVPCGTGRGGLPIGLQIVGRAFDEALVLRAGRCVEQDRGSIPSAAGPAGS